MEIKSKFDIGQTVYFIVGNWVSSGIIESIGGNFSKGSNTLDLNLYYTMKGPNAFQKIQERKLFGTVPELLDFLENNVVDYSGGIELDF